MIHHDNRPYEQGLKEAQQHLEEQIHNKVKSAQRIIEMVQNATPVDRIVGTKGVRFSFRTEEPPQPIKAEKNAIVLPPKHTILMGTRQHNAKNAFEEDLHKHALNQAAGRAGVPETFVNRMLEKPYGAELICENLNTIFSKEEPSRFLVRSVDGQVRGVLSDTYRRMDSRPILDAFATTCKELGAVPVEGVGGDLRFSIKALLPQVYVAGGKKRGSEEVFCFGASLSNSDFGCGALSLQFFLWRIWCSNTATREDSLRRVHLGKRLGEEIIYSDETYQADTKTMVLAVRDHVKGVLAPPKIEEALEMINTALETTIEPKAFFERGGELERLKLNKSEIEKAREAFNNGGVEMLPRGNNVARVSQALAWIAQEADSAERRLELERMAGQLMERKAA